MPAALLIIQLSSAKCSHFSDIWQTVMQNVSLEPKGGVDERRWVSFTVKSLSDTNIIAGVLSEEKKSSLFRKITLRSIKSA
jgi:hypothetical protein